MNIIFIENFGLNFGVASLVPLLRNSGHQVEVIHYSVLKWMSIDVYSNPEKYFSMGDIAEKILKRKPDILLFSVLSANYMFYRNLVDTIKNIREIPVLVGGVFPTLTPQFFFDDSRCDVLFRGEAEPLIVQLVEGIHRNDFHYFPNIVYRDAKNQIISNPMTSFMTDLDKLSFGDHSILSAGTTLYVITSRGCPLPCSYCSPGEYSRLLVEKGKIVRKRSVENVILEIEAAIQERHFNSVFFFDDFFITTIEWLAEFVEHYKRRVNLPFECIAFPGSINQNVAALLAESQCRVVYMGFQTASEEYKKVVLRRRESNEKVARAVVCLQKSGITPSLDHIFNLPGETTEDIRRSLWFYIDHKINVVTINFLNYYPESPLTDWAFENHYFSEEIYRKIKKNRMIGEQSFKGTIVDARLSSRQV